MLIGIVGYERTGKDTCADYICNNYGYEKITFATPIKLISKILFNWDDNILETNNKDNIDDITGIKPREFMKWLGTDIFQYEIYNKFPDLKIKQKTFWVNYVKNNCKNLNKTIIPDVRFLHEAEFIIENNGILIYINKIEKFKSYEILEILNKYQYSIIDNKNNLNQFYNNIKTLLNNF
jgi:dephospho-CoA kinase